MRKRDGQMWRYYLRDVMNPADWLREIKFSRQRKKRGWSDRDTWGGGEYILEVTSGILKKLGDKHSHIDWEDYFITNYPNNLGYKNLNEVAADLDAYLAFDNAGWVDKLGFEIKHGTKELPNGMHELINLNTDEENRKIRDAITRSHEEQEQLYLRAKKAMWFVAVNFRHLWD